MKYLIASDLHGSATYCRQLIDAFAREGAARMILLGDVLYHGPRNDLPDGYAPKEVIAMLAPLRGHIFGVRGNCEAEIDEVVLGFPLLSDYAILPMEDRIIFATHGHIYNENHLPPLLPGDILLHGHTHIKEMRYVGENRDILYLNPGSLSIPKDDDRHSYMIWEDRTFTIKELDGTYVSEITL
ncbi:MAG: phosphodiesterase [Lachnospiraceae bacterium]|nr:phosphodiesterase [Lachnospiraceae bacterium]